MAVEMLHPTPYGWWEKAYVAGPFVGLAVAAAATIALFLKQLDSLSYLAIAVGGNVVFQLALPRLIAPLRMKREAKDAEMGIVECGIRCKSLPPGPPPPAASYKAVGLSDMPRKRTDPWSFSPELPSQVLSWGAL